MECVAEVRLHYGVSHESFLNINPFRSVLSNPQCCATAKKHYDLAELEDSLGESHEGHSLYCGVPFKRPFPGILVVIRTSVQVRSTSLAPFAVHFLYRLHCIAFL